MAKLTAKAIKEHIADWQDFDDLVETLNNYYYEYRHGEVIFTIEGKKVVMYDRTVDLTLNLTKAETIKFMVNAGKFLSDMGVNATDYFNL